LCVRDMHRSRDEDIVLRPTDDFYANASETLRTRAQGMCMCMCGTAVVARALPLANHRYRNLLWLLQSMRTKR
jgi:hypothetical protein